MRKHVWICTPLLTHYLTRRGCSSPITPITPPNYHRLPIQFETSYPHQLTRGLFADPRRRSGFVALRTARRRTHISWRRLLLAHGRVPHGTPNLWRRGGATPCTNVRPHFCVGFVNRAAARALGEVGPAALGWFTSCQEEEEEEEEEQYQ